MGDITLKVSDQKIGQINPSLLAQFGTSQLPVLLPPAGGDFTGHRSAVFSGAVAGPVAYQTVFFVNGVISNMLAIAYMTILMVKNDFFRL